MFASNTSRLRKLKKDLLSIKKDESPLITSDDLEVICMNLSEEAAQDLKYNGYKNNSISYKNLNTETLMELSEKILIVGSGDETVILIDDIS